MFALIWFSNSFPIITKTFSKHKHAHLLFALFIFPWGIVMEISRKLSDRATGNACSGSLLCNLRLSAWQGTVVKCLLLSVLWELSYNQGSFRIYYREAITKVLSPSDSCCRLRLNFYYWTESSVATNFQGLFCCSWVWLMNSVNSICTFLLQAQMANEVTQLIETCHSIGKLQFDSTALKKYDNSSAQELVRLKVHCHWHCHSSSYETLA